MNYGDLICFYCLVICRCGSFLYKCRDFANRCKEKLGMAVKKREICGLKGGGFGTPSNEESRLSG